MNIDQLCQAEDDLIKEMELLEVSLYLRLLLQTLLKAVDCRSYFVYACEK